MAANPLKDLRELSYGRYPITYVNTLEEERAERFLRAHAEKVMSGGTVYRWRASLGMEGPEGLIEGTLSATDALLWCLAQEGAHMFIIYDLHAHWGDPQVVRTMRDCEIKFNQSGARIYIVSPILELPQELQRVVAYYEMPLPLEDEIEKVYRNTLAAFQKHPKIEVTIAEEDTARFVTAGKGLTLREAQQAYMRSFSGRSKVDESCLWAVYKEKESIVKKSQVMEFIPPSLGIDDIGGLNNLKDWLDKRRKIVVGEIKNAHIPVPKGILFMGVSGCGKSLSVKAISAAWDLALFRLDMGRVYSGVAGNPEQAFDNVIKVIEAVAPCIMWIDEIENAVGSTQTASAGGSAGRLFAKFLTWMQEKTAPVFVAATANRIDMLPAEMLRKGRFDQIFFLDLPNEEERGHIFKVHIRNRGGNVENFNFVTLAKSSKQYSGAEIEQVVLTALTEAVVAGKPTFDENDLFKSLGQMVPLATTMSEQIKAIKSWAHDRALKASAD